MDSEDENFYAVNEDDLTSVEFSEESSKEDIPIYEHRDEDIDELLYVGDKLVTSTRRVREDLGTVYLPPLIKKQIHTFISEYNSNPVLRKIYKTISNNLGQENTPYNHLTALLLADENRMEKKVLYTFGDQTNGLLSWQFAFGLGVKHLHVFGPSGGSWLNTVSDMFRGIPQPMIHFESEVFPLDDNAVVIVFDRKGVDQFREFCANSQAYALRNMTGNTVIVSLLDEALLDPATGKIVTQCDFINLNLSQQELHSILMEESMETQESTYESDGKHLLMYLIQYAPGISGGEQARSTAIFTCVNREQMMFNIHNSLSFFNSASEQQYKLISSFQLPFDRRKTILQSLGNLENVEINKNYAALMNVANARMIAPKLDNQMDVAITGGIGSLLCGLYVTHKIPVFLICTNLITYSCCMAKMILLKSFSPEEFIKIHVHISPLMFYHLQPNPQCPVRGRPFVNVIPRINRKIARVLPEGTSAIIRRIYVDKNVLGADNIAEMLSQPDQAQFYAVLHDPLYYNGKTKFLSVNDALAPVSIPNGYKLTEVTFTEDTESARNVPGRLLVYKNEEYQFSPTQIINPNSSFDTSSQLTIYSLGDSLSSSLSSVIESNSMTISYLPAGSIHIDLTTEEEHSLLDLERFMATPMEESPETVPPTNDPLFKLPGAQAVPPDVPISKIKAYEDIIVISDDVGDEETLNNPDAVIVIGDNIVIDDVDDGFFAEPVQPDIPLDNNPIANSETIQNIKQQQIAHVAPELIPVNNRELSVEEIQFIDKITNTLFPLDDQAFFVTQRIFKELMKQTFFMKGPNSISCESFADTVIKVCLMRSDNQQATNNLQAFVSTIMGHSDVPHIDIVKVQADLPGVYTYFKVIMRMLFETVVSSIPGNWTNNKLNLSNDEIAYYNLVQQFPTAIGALFESDLEGTKDVVDKIYNLNLSSKRRWNKYKETFKKTFRYVETRLKFSDAALPPKTSKIIEFLEMFLPPTVAKVFTGNNKRRILPVIETKDIKAEKKYLVLQQKYLERFITAFASKNALKNEINTWFATKQRIIRINDQNYKTDFNLMELANYFLKKKHLESNIYLLERNNINIASDIRFKLFLNLREVVAEEKRKRGPRPAKKTKRVQEDIVLSSVKKARKDSGPIFLDSNALSELETINVCAELNTIQPFATMPGSPMSASELRHVQNNILNSSLSDTMESNTVAGSQPLTETSNEIPAVLENLPITPIKPIRKIQPALVEDVPTILVPDTNVTALVVASNNTTEAQTNSKQLVAADEQRMALEKKAAREKRRKEKISRRLASFGRFVPNPKIPELPEKNLPSVLVSDLLGQIETKWKELISTGNISEEILNNAANAYIDSASFREKYSQSYFGTIDEYYNSKISYLTEKNVLYAVVHEGDFNPVSEEPEIEIDLIDSDDEFDEDETYEKFDEFEYVTESEYNLIDTLFGLMFVTFTKYQVADESMPAEVQELVARCCDTVVTKIKALEEERKKIQDEKSADTIYNHLTLNGNEIVRYRMSVSPRLIEGTNRPTEEIVNAMLNDYEMYGHPLEARIVEIQARRNYHMSLQYAPFFQFFGKRQKAIKSSANYDLLLGSINKAMMLEIQRELDLEILLLNINLLVFHPRRKALLKSSFYSIVDMEEEKDEAEKEEEKPPEPGKKKRKKTVPVAKIVFDPKATDVEKVIQILIQEKQDNRKSTAQKQLTASSSEPPSSADPGYTPETSTPVKRVDILQNYNLINIPLTIANFRQWIISEDPLSLLDILQRIRTVRQNFNVSAFVGVNLRELRARAKAITPEEIKQYSLTRYDLLIKWYEDFVKRYTFNASLLETESKLDLTRYTRWKLNLSFSDTKPVQQGLQNLAKTIGMSSGTISDLGVFGGDVYRKIFYYSSVGGDKSTQIVAYYKKVFNAAVLYKRVKKVIDNQYQIHWSPTLSSIHPGWMTIANDNPTADADTNALILFYLQFLKVFEQGRTAFDAKAIVTVCHLLTVVSATRFVGIYDDELAEFLLRINCSDFKALHRYIWEGTTNPYAYTTYKNLLLYYEQNLSASCGIGSELPENNFEDCNLMYRKYRLLVLRALEYVRTAIDVMKQINERLLLTALVGDRIMEDKTVVSDVFAVNERTKTEMAGLYADAVETKGQNKTEQKDASQLYLLIYERNKTKYQLENQQTMRKKLASLRLNAQNMLIKLLYIGIKPETYDSDEGYKMRVNSALSDSDWVSDNEQKIESIKEDLTNLFASATITKEKNPSFNVSFAMLVLRESLKPNFLKLGFAIQNSVTIAQTFSSEVILDGGSDNTVVRAEGRLTAFARRITDPSTPADQRIILRRGAPVYFNRIYVKNNPLYAKGNQTTVLRLF